MKILITGGAGYIGSHACVALLKAGYEVVLVDNFSNSDKKVINSIKQIAEKELDSYLIDLRSKDEIERIFREQDIQGVIHFAGLKSVPESVEKPLEYYENNVAGTINLLNAMDKYKVNQLVFSSSATVYGMNNIVPYRENMPLAATSPYGWTKVMIEQILDDFARVHENMHVVKLRYFNPIGADPSGLIGDKPEGIPNNLMPYLCQTAVGKLPYIKVCGTDYDTKDGTGVRDYVHVNDLVDGHLKALESLDKMNGSKAYNLGRGKGTSVLELVDTFEAVTGMQIKRVFCDRRPGDISESYADVSKAKEDLGWEAKLTLEDMCRDCWNYIRKNG
jgi:UDP-glucose 4-epimerase